MSPRTFIEETRTSGFRKAFRSLFGRRLPLLGYLVLALATAYTVTAVNDNQTEARSELRGAAVEVVEVSCKRDNQTRTVLRGLLRQNFSTVREYVKEGTLTQAQADRSIKQTRKAIKNLRNTDCEALSETFRLESLDGEAR